MEQSLKSGEPIHGTATAGVEVWLLLENRDRWEADIADTPFPQPVRRLFDQLSKRREVRLQLIRGESQSGPLSFYVVLTSPFRTVHHFHVDDYDALLALDVAAILTGEVTSRPDTKPLYLVCTHGRRDACCARYGTAFYKQLCEAAPDAHVWQSSHQGGHRFAANVLYLPAGIHYGRLNPDEAADMVEAHQRGELYGLGRYRGQTRLSPPAQAAEGWLREQEQLMSLQGPELTSLESLAGNCHAATFRAADGMIHRLTVAPRRGTAVRKTSCNADDASVATWFYVVRHEAQTAEAARRAPASEP